MIEVDEERTTAAAATVIWIQKTESSVTFIGSSFEQRHFYIFYMARAVFFKMYIQQLKLRRYHNRLCIAEVAPSVSLYVRINPVLMGRHTAVDTGEALL